MEVKYTSYFLRKLRKVPSFIQTIAEKKIEIFKSNPFNSSLRTHKLQGHLNDLWSFSVNHDYRIIFEFVDSETVYFLSIGKHDIYQ